MDCLIVGMSLDLYKQVPEYILGPVSVSVVHGLQYLWSLKIMHRGLSVLSMDSVKIINRGMIFFLWRVSKVYIEFVFIVYQVLQDYT